MSTYAFLPGAWHGGWCWERVAAHIAAAGHRVIAIDFPCEDQAAGCAAYCEIAIDVIGEGGGDLVVVGHSAGGLTAPLVAAARPTRRLVLVSALLPQPGRPFTEQNEDEGILEEDYQAGIETDGNGNRVWVDRELCARTMYSGCSPADVNWAFAQLRPQASTMYTEPSPLANWPEAAITDIRGAADRLVSPAWAARAVPARLGITSAVLPGAGHSPMLSHPRELAALLLAA